MGDTTTADGARFGWAWELAAFTQKVVKTLWVMVFT
jgi:hypothetical protein